MGDAKKSPDLGKAVAANAAAAAQAQDVLSIRLESLERAGEAFFEKADAFEAKIAALEKKLTAQHKKYEKVRLDNRALTSQLEAEREEHARALAKKEDEIARAAREIEQYINEREALMRNVELLSRKSEKYDQMKRGVSRIRLQAEREAGALVDQARLQTMEAAEQVEHLTEEVRKIRAGGPLPASPEERLSAFYRAIDRAVEELTVLHGQFAQRNHLPPAPGPRDPHVASAIFPKPPDVQAAGTQSVKNETAKPPVGGRKEGDSHEP